MPLDPDHYRVRLDAIAHVVSNLAWDAPKPVVLLGGAICEKNPAKTLSGFPVLNMGIADDEIQHAHGGVITRLQLLPLARPAHVFLLIGLNDLTEKDKNPLSIEPQYDELVRAIQKTVPATELHLQSLLPTRDGYSRFMPQIAILNVMIEEMAARHSVKFLDTFAPMEDDEGHLVQNYTEDGLHLNDSGYEALNAILERHLRSGEAY